MGTPVPSITAQSLPGSGEGGSGTSFLAAMSRARSQARRHALPCDAELGVARREAAPAGRAVIPGPRQGDRAEHRVDDLVPAGDEFRLVPPPARHPRAAVAAVGGQQLLQHAPAQPRQPGPDHRLRCLHPGIAAARDPGRLGGQPA
ncbi:MAG TPA: hypothetical protein VMV07_03800 [Streptosporangiaceae bacterium]|nr:hypothetical protein [Streptosporangiaceae bacterium]